MRADRERLPLRRVALALAMGLCTFAAAAGEPVVINRFYHFPQAGPPEFRVNFIQRLRTRVRFLDALKARFTRETAYTEEEEYALQILRRAPGETAHWHDLQLDCLAPEFPPEPPDGGGEPPDASGEDEAGPVYPFAWRFTCPRYPGSSAYFLLEVLDRDWSRVRIYRCNSACAPLFGGEPLRLADGL
jgi:hypothetical protein